MTQAFCINCNNAAKRKKGEWQPSNIKNETKRNILTASGKVRGIVEGTCPACNKKISAITSPHEGMEAQTTDAIEIRKFAKTISGQIERFVAKRLK